MNITRHFRPAEIPSSKTLSRPGQECKENEGEKERHVKNNEGENISVGYVRKGGAMVIVEIDYVIL